MTKVQLGDRYCETDGGKNVWVVSEVIRPSGDMPHARLRSEIDRTAEKLIAARTLCDSRRFRRLDEGQYHMDSEQWGKHPWQFTVSLASERKWYADAVRRWRAVR